ncbi:hypothetical protein CRUP_017183 [Coryphaenoides rupestris]|nr:hypothetical protein CRUP_017183 [Coryphaenoides rupestris]
MKRRWEERVREVEGLAQAFQKTPLSAPYRPRLSSWPCQPSSVWRLFPRQHLAMGFMQTCREDVHVFALEKDKGGQRIYLVTSYTELWHYYRTFQHSLMHCYEVIPEGAVCKLYFDLEFHRPSNQGLDGTAMVAFLVQYVCEQLMDVYGVACTASDVLNLDSSTEDKFSRHLIFCVDGAVFSDNIHMGQFVHAILSKSPNTLANPDSDSENHDPRRPRLPAETREDSPPPGPTANQRQKPGQTTPPRDLGCLKVKGEQGQEAGIFVDLGVYTRNRNFRLYKSSKAGKAVALTLAEDNQFTPRPRKNVTPEQNIFLASLVCNVRWDAPDGTGPNRRSDARRAEATPGHALPGALGGGSTAASPYKEVDDFVLTVVRKDGVQGCVRRWNYFVGEQLLVYDILKYRWCENVGRFHKSNNIMRWNYFVGEQLLVYDILKYRWVLVDLKEEIWYQKCHDPACRTFRSSSYPLPQEICASYLMKRDEEEEEESYVMDAAGNIGLREEVPGGPPRRAPQPDAPLDDWADVADDRAYAEALEDFEQSGAPEFSEAASENDRALLEFMTDFESGELTNEK